MIMYNLWQYCRDERDDDNVTYSESFKFKSRFVNLTGNCRTDLFNQL